MTTSSGRRRQQFPGVPPPGGGHDVDTTHVWPGLAAELRDEPRDPAMAELTGNPGPDVGGLHRGDTVTVDLGDGEPTRHRVESATEDALTGTVTLTPLDEQGEPSGPPQANPVDVWGGSEPGVAHLGLADRSADVEPADVEAWAAARGRHDADRPLGWPEGTEPIRLPLDGTPEPEPAPELGGPPTWQIGTDEDEREVVVDPADGERRAWFGDGEDRPHPDDEPEYRAETTEDGEGVAITMPCGCGIVLRPCR